MYITWARIGVRGEDRLHIVWGSPGMLSENLPRIILGTPPILVPIFLLSCAIPK